MESGRSNRRSEPSKYCKSSKEIFCSNSLSIYALGRLRLNRLLFLGNKFFPISPPGQLWPLPLVICHKLTSWVNVGKIATAVSWTAPPPTIWVDTNASGEVGWGYQSYFGHQNHGRWISPVHFHINAMEILAPLFFLGDHKVALRGKPIAFRRDSQTSVYCLQKQGSSRSWILQ